MNAKSNTGGYGGVYNFNGKKYQRGAKAEDFSVLNTTVRKKNNGIANRLICKLWSNRKNNYYDETKSLVMNNFLLF